MDFSGNVYIVDETLRIQKFTSDGTFIYTINISSLAGGTAYEKPRDIVVDNDGTIFMSKSVANSK